MSKKYRLVRTAPGVLDLSQVLDDQGRPVLLRMLTDYAIVDASTAKHPLVTRFVGAGLAIEEISPVPATSVPIVPTVAVTPPTPEPRIIVPEPALAPEPAPEPIPEPAPAPEELVVVAEDAGPKPESAPVDEPITHSKKSKKHGR